MPCKHVQLTVFPHTTLKVHSVPKAQGAHTNIHKVDLLGVWRLSHLIALKDTLSGL